MAIAKTPKTDPIEPVEPVEPEAVEVETLAPGFHVVINGVSHGCYPTAADAENYALGQLVPQGLEYEIIEA